MQLSSPKRAWLAAMLREQLRWCDTLTRKVPMVTTLDASLRLSFQLQRTRRLIAHYEALLWPRRQHPTNRPPV